jgi:hypothetical protein
VLKINNLAVIDTLAYYKNVKITQFVEHKHSFLSQKNRNYTLLTANTPAYCSKMEIADFLNKNSKSLLKIGKEQFDRN